MEPNTTTTTVENTNQTAVVEPKLDGQPAAATVADPAQAVVTAEAAKVDSSAAPVEAPKVEKPVVPEKYDLKLSDGSYLDPAALPKIEAYAKKYGLSQEAAQELVASEEADKSAFYEAQKAGFETRKANWIKEGESDKEIGGANYREAVAEAHNVLKKFASEAHYQTLIESGLGNNPEFIRTFYRIAKAGIMNDKFVQSKGTPEVARKSNADVFYGSENKQ